VDCINLGIKKGSISLNNIAPKNKAAHISGFVFFIQRVSQHTHPGIYLLYLLTNQIQELDVIVDIR
jgi:hypothetical protein